MGRPRKSRLSYKIFAILSGVLFSIFFFSTWIFYTLVHDILAERLEDNLATTVNGVRQIIETSATLAVRSYLRSLAEQDRHLLEDLEGRVQAGELTRQEAEEFGKRILLAQRIARSGYTYAINSQGLLVVHPKDTLVGADLSEQSLGQRQTNRKFGFLEYDWQNPGEPAPRHKILYMEHFAPWDWIISVTAYRDELTQLIDIADFRDRVLSITIGQEGYPLLLDLDGRILIHPDLSGRIDDLAGPNRELLQKLVSMRQGRLTYDWIDPGSGASIKKIALFSTIEEFGWLVAATGRVDDFFAPMKTLRTIVLALFAVALAASIVVSIVLSRYISAPLVRLLAQLSRQENDGQPSLLADGAGDEIEEIAGVCQRYVQSLRQSNDKLADLVAEQRQTALGLSIYKEVFLNVVEGITITDTTGTIIQANPAFEKITGYSAAEAIGKTPRLLKSDYHAAEFYQAMWESIARQGFWSGEIWNKRKNGEIYPEWLTISAIRDHSGDITHYAAVFNDITTTVRQQERINFLAYHDSLTELPNRLLALERMHQAFRTCQRKGGSVGCLIVDIDNFKTVNDSIGHDVGDLLLQELVRRLLPTLRGDDTFGRLGGDEFILLFHDEGEAGNRILSVLEGLYHQLEAPFVFDEQKVYVTVSVGIATHPADAATPEELLKRTELALYNAKQSNGNSSSFFSARFEEEARKKLHYLAKIRSGLEHREFLPFYQPKVDLATGQAVGMEALARWRSEGRLVSPADFIPLSEQSGLIMPLARDLYRQAFRETARLRGEGHDLKLSVNLSPTQLRADTFLDELLQLQSESGLPAEAIELEVTESSLMADVERSRRLLDRLVGHGFTIALDDFGTGYSSLQYLKQIPLHTMKIDMSFVSGIGSDRDDEKLIETIILMAGQFGLSIVAEGVEGMEQEGFLRARGCHFGQGYLYGKPMDFEEFRGWLRRRPSPPVSEAGVSDSALRGAV